MSNWWTRANMWAKKFHKEHEHWQTVGWFVSPLASGLALLLVWLQINVAPTVANYIAVAAGWVFIAGLALAVLVWILAMFWGDERGYWMTFLGLPMMLISTGVLYAVVGRYYISFTPEIEGLSPREARFRLIDQNLLPAYRQSSKWSIPDHALIVRDQWPLKWVPAPVKSHVTFTLDLNTRRLDGMPVGALSEYGLSYSHYLETNNTNWYLGDLRPPWLPYALISRDNGRNNFYETLKLSSPGDIGAYPGSGFLAAESTGLLQSLLTADVAEDVISWDSSDGSLTFAPVLLGDSISQMDQKALASTRPFSIHYYEYRNHSAGKIWGIFQNGKTIGLLRSPSYRYNYYEGWMLVTLQRPTSFPTQDRSP